MDDESADARRRARHAHDGAAVASDEADKAGRRAQQSLARFKTVDGVANRSRLQGAGYVLDVARSVWLHDRIRRALDAEMADQLTDTQLTTWLAEGVRRSS
jgi:hypothetical protein